MKKSKSVLITDLDNTLFNWFEIWFKSFKPMLSEIYRISQIPEDTLKAEIKAVHQKHGTAEYAFLIEEIPSLLAKYGSKEKTHEVMSLAIEAYRKGRSENLKLYDGVESTLEKIKNCGTLIVAYTESKSYYSSYRIKKLGLDKYIDILYSPEDHEVPSSHQPTSFKFQKTKVKHTPKGELKPNPQLLLDIISSVDSSPENCVYIGDSEMKDIDMAQKAGVDDVFARYGAVHFDNNEGISMYNLLREVTHWTQADVEREDEIKKNYHEIEPTLSIDNFGDLLNHFNFTSYTKV
ncbi:HAD hydrolase-like protein [Shewanella algae]|uniref:HAD hydrolase-like protein n=1 Tax=Shewanella algae TaxID=38313 RepID=UPI0031F4FFF6